ncbi:nicotinate-nucleotide adenylyltransferase [Hymenobacter sp. HMF4947]|uniref:Probable nicotinate-nucleotide adenylyltransferase n=1 Tax=Hymenobacter ginkgonis TaxID=2682976 RepID=A0A7K1TEV9_9BACT|nr:nicotinate (nicotinamide) nucleotide adenylyltransferase [Hymenobacter ginkgonis]MVN76661.1 nicotinate-nucleotide adenylyltransferase [Hymenobacter ginkgonis]
MSADVTSVAEEADSSIKPAQRIGLLFGSFNPVHHGHLILAEYFATRTDLDAVWLVLSPQSPFKVDDDLLPDTARLALLKLAIAENPLLRAEDIELSLTRPSYTIATLDALGKRYPRHSFVLLMGADNLAGIPRWRAADRLIQEFDLYAYPRPGAFVPKLTDFPRARLVSAPMLDISGTYIRQSVRDRKSIRYLVPSAVEDEIAAQDYYR